MEQILALMSNFEERNNISINMRLESDGSGTVNEFWDEEELIEFDNLNELQEFLRNTQYQLSEDGRCISPFLKLNK